MFSRVAVLTAAATWTCLVPTIMAAQPTGQLPTAKEGNQRTILRGKVALQQINLELARLRKWWTQCRVLLARGEQRQAVAFERYRAKVFQRLRSLNDADFGSYQQLVDEADSRWKKAVAVLGHARRNVKATELDLAVEEARVKLAAARLERAKFYLMQLLHRSEERP